MANRIKVKRSAVQGKVPQTTDLELGELAINTYDGKLFAKINNGSESVVQLGSADGVAAGGSAGQVLRKIDGTDYNTEWVDPSVALSANGSHDYGLIVQSVSGSIDYGALV